MRRAAGWLAGVSVVVLVAVGPPRGALAAQTGSTPAVTGVSPTSGPTQGNTQVTISGINFVKGKTTVRFGSVNASANVINQATIIAVSPAQEAGTVDVTATTADGTSGTSSADRFTYQDAPVVHELVPVSGPLEGGTTVTIEGANFIGATAVEFGLVPSPNFKVKDANTIQAITPGGSGPVAVTVTTTSGSNAGGSRFTYEGPPVIGALDPPSGPPSGGTQVQIVGANFVGALGIDWGNGTIGRGGFGVDKQGDTITLAAPKGSVGDVNVRVVTTSGTSDPSTFTYQGAPSLTALAPRFGSTKGGTKVVIKGHNLIGALKVSFGDQDGTNIDVASASSLSVIAPAGTGTVDVRVTTSSGTSPKSSSHRFTYQGAPVVKSVTPSSGSPSGGTKVTIEGSGLLGTIRVSFGATAATGVKIVSSTEITATSPSGTGTVHVVVTTTAGSSAKRTADQFTYATGTPSGGVGTGGGGTAGRTLPWVPLALIVLSLVGLASVRLWHRRA
jgi:hypothetical protein